MTQAKVPQSISGVPARWGRFTAPQLGWLVIAAVPLYISFHAHLPLLPVFLGSSPWVAGATAMAFGRRQGRRLDAFTADWALFRLHRKRFDHPDSETTPRDAKFVVVDASEPRSLPWAQS